ncbi:MAG: phosphatase PAP2 family protein [Solirubrobacterales bacterium]|nr:phosphatase PAP2 family protein [Solirubrobacterales bacterium]
MKQRSATHRRRGPNRRSPLAQATDSVTLSIQRRLRRGKGPAIAAALAVPVLVALTLKRKRVGLHPVATLVLGCGVPLGAAIAVPQGRPRYAAIAAGYMYLFKLSWELPYDDPERLRRRLLIDEPIRFDSFVGGGVPVGLRLQRALRTKGEISAFDIAVTAVYGSWFVPHLVLGYLLVRHDEYVPRAGGRLSAAYHLTTPFYWLWPEAPPWYAAEKEGRMDGELDRVARAVVCHILKREPPDDGSVPGNPWASMPSDHISSAAITALGLTEINPIYGAVGWAYVGAAAFAVVYLGEHYVADVLVGLAIAGAVEAGEVLAAPFIRAVTRSVSGTSPER